MDIIKNKILIIITTSANLILPHPTSSNLIQPRPTSSNLVQPQPTSASELKLPQKYRLFPLRSGWWARTVGGLMNWPGSALNTKKLPGSIFKRFGTSYKCFRVQLSRLPRRNHSYSYISIGTEVNCAYGPRTDIARKRKPKKTHVEFTESAE